MAKSSKNIINKIIFSQQNRPKNPHLNPLPTSRELKALLSNIHSSPWQTAKRSIVTATPWNIKVLLLINQLNRWKAISNIHQSLLLTSTLFKNRKRSHQTLNNRHHLCNPIKHSYPYNPINLPLLFPHNLQSSPSQLPNNPPYKTLKSSATPPLFHNKKNKSN